VKVLENTIKIKIPYRKQQRFPSQRSVAFFYILFFQARKERVCLRSETVALKATVFVFVVKFLLLNYLIISYITGWGEGAVSDIFRLESHMAAAEE